MQSCCESWGRHANDNFESAITMKTTVEDSKRRNTPVTYETLKTVSFLSNVGKFSMLDVLYLQFLHFSSDIAFSDYVISN